MRFFGKRLGWGGKFWLGCMLALPTVMLLGHAINVPWLWLPFVALYVVVVMPTLNILDGQNKKRGGKGILFVE